MVNIEEEEKKKKGKNIYYTRGKPLTLFVDKKVSQKPQMRKAINSTKVHHCTHHDTLSKSFCLYQIHLTYLLRKERAFADKHPEFDLSFTTLKGCQASLYNSQFLKLLLSSGMEIRFRVVGMYTLLLAIG